MLLREAKRILKRAGYRINESVSEFNDLKDIIAVIKREIDEEATGHWAGSRSYIFDGSSDGATADIKITQVGQDRYKFSYYSTADNGWETITTKRITNEEELWDAWDMTCDY